MALITSDIKIHYSVDASSGNFLPGNAFGSLGEFFSTTEMLDSSENNLFEDVSGDDNVAGTIDYKCVFIYNSNLSFSFVSVQAYLLSEVVGGASVAIGVDPVAASLIGSSSQQATGIVNRNEIPTGVVFYSAVYPITISLGTIPPSSCKALWIRRTSGDTAAVSDDGVVIRLHSASTVDADSTLLWSVKTPWEIVPLGDIP